MSLIALARLATLTKNAKTCVPKSLKLLALTAVITLGLNGCSSLFPDKTLAYVDSHESPAIVLADDSLYPAHATHPIAQLDTRVTQLDDGKFITPPPPFINLNDSAERLQNIEDWQDAVSLHFDGNQQVVLFIRAPYQQAWQEVVAAVNADGNRLKKQRPNLGELTTVLAKKYQQKGTFQLNLDPSVNGLLLTLSQDDKLADTDVSTALLTNLAAIIKR